MILTSYDIRIIQNKGYHYDFFVKEHNGWLQLKNKKGRCVFHDGTVCTIYPQRPKGCTLYPVVYDKDNTCAILDNECPQRPCFSLSKRNRRQLTTLVRILEEEREERMQKTI
jgi:Fe-S-cluster containining protein